MSSNSVILASHEAIAAENVRLRAELNKFIAMAARLKNELNQERRKKAKIKKLLQEF